MKSEDNQQEAVNAQVSINSENQISGLYCLNRSTGNSICKHSGQQNIKPIKSIQKFSNFKIDFSSFIYIFLFCKGKNLLFDLNKSFKFDLSLNKALSFQEVKMVLKIVKPIQLLKLTY